MGPIEMQAMEEDGYDKEFSIGITAAFICNWSHYPTKYSYGSLRRIDSSFDCRVVYRWDNPWMFNGFSTLWY